VSRVRRALAQRVLRARQARARRVRLGQQVQRVPKETRVLRALGFRVSLGSKDLPDLAPASKVQRAYKALLVRKGRPEQGLQVCKARPALARRAQRGRRVPREVKVQRVLVWLALRALMVSKEQLEHRERPGLELKVQRV